MDKVVIFDWGGIVESHEENMKDLFEARIRMVKRFNPALSAEEILSLWTNVTPRGNNAGAVNDEDEIKEWLFSLQKKLGINVSLEEFIKAYEEEGRKIKSYQDVAEYAHSLKDRCKIVILSNLLPIDKTRIDEQYDLSQFDYVYLSFELGLRKPDPKIYECVLQDLGVKSEDILFIDDDSDNIRAAKECGWNTCLGYGYDLEKIKEAVEAFLEEK